MERVVKGKISIKNLLIFLQQKKTTDKDEDVNALYTVPVKPKPVPPKTETPTSDAPKEQDKPVSLEPQVIEASGFFNPMYQTRAQVQEFTDISSIFATPSPPPEQKIDDEGE